MMHRAILAMFLTLPLLTGCPSATVTSGPTAQTPYQKAATVMLNFSTDVLSAEGTEINLYKGGVVPPNVHAAMKQAFIQIGVYGQQIDALIAAQASATTVQAKIDSLGMQIAAVVTASSGLDANTKAQITAAMQAIQLLLAGVTAALNQSTAEVRFGPGNDRTIGSIGRTVDYPGNWSVPADRRRAWSYSEAAGRYSGRSRRQLCPDRV